MDGTYAGRLLRRPRWRCNATEELLRPRRKVAVFAAPAPEVEALDPRVLDAHLLRVSKELTVAMLALRPSSPDAYPDPARAYDRMHAAMSDLAGVYQYSQVGQMRAARSTRSAGAHEDVPQMGASPEFDEEPERVAG